MTAALGTLLSDRIRTPSRSPHYRNRESVGGLDAVAAQI
jgi:hypothetical protein